MKILDIPQSGKKGLEVSMNGRYGQVRRTFVIPTNPRTASQMTVPTKLSAVAKRRWTLTENQRQAWNMHQQGQVKKLRNGNGNGSPAKAGPNSPQAAALVTSQPSVKAGSG